jgi:hypothetical protein
MSVVRYSQPRTHKLYIHTSSLIIIRRRHLDVINDVPRIFKHARRDEDHRTTNIMTATHATILIALALFVAPTIATRRLKNAKTATFTNNCKTPIDIWRYRAIDATFDCRAVANGREDFVTVPAGKTVSADWWAPAGAEAFFSPRAENDWNDEIAKKRTTTAKTAADGKKTWTRTKGVSIGEWARDWMRRANRNCAADDGNDDAADTVVVRAEHGREYKFC